MQRLLRAFAVAAIGLAPLAPLIPSTAHAIDSDEGEIPLAPRVSVLERLASMSGDWELTDCVSAHDGAGVSLDGERTRIEITTASHGTSVYLNNGGLLPNGVLFQDVNAPEKVDRLSHSHPDGRKWWRSYETATGLYAYTRYCVRGRMVLGLCTGDRAERTARLDLLADGHLHLRAREVTSRGRTHETTCRLRPVVR